MTGLLIGIISVIITVLFGYYSIKVSKKQGITRSILFKTKECFSLLNSPIDNLQIDVKYKNENVENVLIILKAQIINTGNTDIDKSSIYKPIKIITNENFNWLEIKPARNENNINVTVKKLNDKEVSIEWDLLKKGEKIEIEALVEAKKRKEFSNNFLYSFDFIDNLNFESRITNIDKIDIEDRFNDSYYFKREIKYSILPYIAIGLFGILLFFIPYLSDIIPIQADYLDINYELLSKSNDSLVICKILPQDKNDIRLSNSNKLLRKKIFTIDAFNNDYSLKGIKSVEENKFLLITRILGLLFFIWAIFSIIRKINELNKYKKDIKSRNANNGS